ESGCECSHRDRSKTRYGRETELRRRRADESNSRDNAAIEAIEQHAESGRADGAADGEETLNHSVLALIESLVVQKSRQPTQNEIDCQVHEEEPDPEKDRGARASAAEQRIEGRYLCLRPTRLAAFKDGGLRQCEGQKRNHDERNETAHIKYRAP